MNDSPGFAIYLPDLVLIEITGDDAPGFLHGQLTQDVLGLTENQAKLAGYCTAKGRLLGTMVIWQDKASTGSRVYALVKADIASALIKRLSMFVLRAKVSFKIDDAKVIGVSLAQDKATDKAVDPGSAGLLAIAQNLVTPSEPWTITRTSEGSWITAPGADTADSRWWFIANSDRACALDVVSDEKLTAQWQASDIAAGLPWVESTTQDVFIPQTLNLDLIDAVSFTKGCYPGQEVVARSHYRGTVKRRTAYGFISEPVTSDPKSLAGVDTYDANKPDNPCGRIVNAAHATRTGSTTVGMHVLMEVQLSDMGVADFRLERPDGPAIRLENLPYSVKAED